MNRVLGFTFFLLLLAAIAFISLRDMRPIAESNADTVYTGIDWRPVSFGDESVDPGMTMSLRFEDDGKISGHSGCNGFFATYTMTESGIEISPIGATRMACPEPQMTLENRFFDVLDRTVGIDARGQRLRLLDIAGNTLAVFVSASMTESS